MSTRRLSPILLMALAFFVIRQATTPKVQTSPTNQPRDSLVFELNQGQTGAGVRYTARTPGAAMLFTSHGPIVRIRAGDFAMRFVGGRDSLPEGLDPLPSRVNYFLGNDPSRWRTSVPTFGRIVQRDVYPGIDIEYYGHEGRLEYDIVVAPGADPRCVRLRFEGADQTFLTAHGIAIAAKSARAEMLAPVVYQRGHKRVAGEYIQVAANEYGLKIGTYDHSQPLIVDPIFAYSTTIGGQSADISRAIAVDSAGAVYIAGQTFSIDYPTQPPFENAFGGAGNFFVTKLDPTGSKLVYSTVIGGLNDDNAFALALDATGDVYVTGYTNSPNFPIVGGFQPQGTKAPGDTSSNITQDVFVLKLNPQGTGIVYSSYLGGSGSEVGRAIGVDAAGNAYIAGSTQSIDFPTVNAIQRIKGDALTFSNDAFVTKVNPSGSAIVYSTFLGGLGDDQALGIAVDGAGNAYVTGTTSSQNFPVVNAYQSMRGSAAAIADAFITKFNPAGTALVYSTYLGGASSDFANAIAIDSGGNAYVGGVTNSRDFPLLPAQQAVGTAFLAKLSADGSQLRYSKAIGGNGSDTILAIAVDSAGNACIGGQTSSTNFPIVNGIQKPADFLPPGGTFYTAGFVQQIDVTGTTILFSTLLGGGGESVQGLAVANGNIYATGSTSTVNFPTYNGFQTIFAGATDAFVTKFTDGTQPAPVIFPGGIVNGASFRLASDPNGAIAPGALIGIFGTDLAPASRFSNTLPLPMSLFDTTVTFNGIPAPLFNVSSLQIDAQVPFAVPTGTATVKVTRRDGATTTQTVQVAQVSPGIFFGPQQGVQVGAILHSKDFSQISPQNPAFSGEFLSIYCTGLGAVNPPSPEGVVPPAPPPVTVLSPTVTIGGINAPVSYSGLAARLAAVYQINVVVPAGVASGNQPVLLTIGGVTSNSVITSMR